MRREPVYREGSLGGSSITVEERAGGVLIVKSLDKLAAYPVRITDRLVDWARQTPDRTFVAKRGDDGRWRHISFRDMLERARCIGQALLDRKLSAERPLVILSENDLEHATLAAAALYAGVPFAPVSPAYSLISKDFGKLKDIIALLTPGMVFAADGRKFLAAIEATVADDVEIVVTAHPLSGRPSTLFGELLATPATAAVDAAHAAITADSIAKFLFTSGSTKAPKGVINTQRMLCSNQQVVAQAFPFFVDEAPVLVDWLPWNHTFGGNHNYGIAMYNGGTLYIDDGKPLATMMRETLRNLKEISPTIYFNVPKGFEELAHALAADAELRTAFFRNLRLMFYAGAGLPKPVAEALYAIAEGHCGERVGIYTGLGMTETAPFALGIARVGAVAGAIGCPAPGVTMKLVPNQDKLELRYQGAGVTPGYWRASGHTAEAFDEEGFFRSGDAVKFLDRSRPNLGFVFDGRIAEDFKLSTGTWVSVGPLRTAVLAEGAPHVLDVVITGHDRDDVGLLIFPRVDSCRALAGLAAEATAHAVVRSTPVREFFAGMIDALQAQATGSANRISRALILAEPPSIDHGEITDKGSLNQHVVLAQRAAAVEALYADVDEVIKRRP